MVSWLRGSSAKEWNAQLRETLSRAADSVKIVAEQTQVEIRGGLNDTQAGIAQLSESLRASAHTVAQSLAEGGEDGNNSSGIFTGDASLLAFADKVQSTVSSLGAQFALGEADEDEEEETFTTVKDLTRQFAGEALALVAAIEDERRNVAVVERALRRWDRRLSRRVIAPAYRVRGKKGSVAGSVAGSSHSPSNGSSGSSGGDVPANVLVAFLRSHALKSVLAALARSTTYRGVLRGTAVAAKAAVGEVEEGPMEKVDDKDLACGASLWPLFRCASSSKAPVELLSQVLELLADAADADAADVQQKVGSGSSDSAICGAAAQNMQWVLVLVSGVLLDSREAECIAKSSLQQAVEEATAAADAAGANAVSSDSSQVGSEVWARWPGDGRWYRASVKDLADDHVDVVWLCPQPGGTSANALADGGSGSEYMPRTLESDGSQIVDELGLEDVVPVARQRPGTSAKESRCNEADIHRWAQSVADVESCARDIFKLTELRTLSANAQTGVAVSDDGPRVPDLSSTADSLKALRSQGEFRTETLSKAHAASAETEHALQEKLRAGSDGVREELETIQSKRAEHDERVRVLTAEREDILAKLRAVDEQLASEVKLAAELSNAELEIKTGVARTSDEFVEKLQDCTSRGANLLAQRRVVSGAADISLKVEALLESRAAAVAAAGERCSRLGDAGPALANARVVAEHARMRKLEELLASWQGAIWGPHAQALASNAEQANALRNAHLRAGSLVEQAWREAVQTAAEDLPGSASGKDGLTASEEMTQFAARYKAMRRELEGNLERLSRLEAGVPAQAIAAPAATQAPLVANGGYSSTAAAAPAISAGAAASSEATIPSSAALAPQATSAAAELEASDDAAE